MKPILFHNLKLLAILGLFLSIITFGACSKNSQTVQMLDAAPVTCELYGTCTKSFSLVIDQVDSISWAALDWSGEYKYFEVTQIKIGQKTYEGDGSTHVFETLTLAKSNVVTVTYTYSPLTAQEDVETPHHATLKLVGATPQLATIQVDLTGYVQGVCDSEVEECNFTSTAELTAIPYQLVNNQLTIYMCHPELEAFANDSQGRDFVREDLVTIEDPFVFYEDQDGIHVVRNDGEGLDPTIPTFDAPVPEGALSANLTSLTVSMEDIQNVTCGADEEGNLECLDIGISIMGAISLDFTATTGSIEPTTSQCKDFGSVSGDGEVGEDQITIVGWAAIPSNPLDQFLDALVVVVVSLELVTD